MVPTTTAFLTLTLFCCVVLLIITLLFPLNAPSPEHVPFKFNHSYKRDAKPQIVHSGNRLSLPILIYHYIGNNPNPKDLARDNLSVSPDKFEAQMKFLAEGGFYTLT
jgi:hypothetical protein